jgi:hypothetical protein
LPFEDVHIAKTDGSNSEYGGFKRDGGYEIDCGCLFMQYNKGGRIKIYM